MSACPFTTKFIIANFPLKGLSTRLEGGPFAPFTWRKAFYHLSSVVAIAVYPPFASCAISDFGVDDEIVQPGYAA
jgi:hypothetical protein